MRVTGQQVLFGCDIESFFAYFLLEESKRKGSLRKGAKPLRPRNARSLLRAPPEKSLPSQGRWPSAAMAGGALAVTR